MALCQIWRESNLSAYDPMHSMHSMHFAFAKASEADMDISHHLSMTLIYGIMVNGRSPIGSACDSGHSGHSGHIDVSIHLSTPLVFFIIPLNQTESIVHPLILNIIFVISV
ncbi:MAG: hypothetical protein EZS28_012051 [Streblomastix strix]|uniref:Uncharacterized protein n=1 Tax=Streblomastix strix TaxID=222440 RepID=A0A5J4WDK3_9EUKA|nr:MAG: hypothetical protein EZS28_012051 [Streblomastix strix]